MNPLRVAGWAVSLLCDVLAPVPKPWPLSEQPLIDGEPPLTGNELTGVRQLLEERFNTTPEHGKPAEFEPMPGWFRGGFDEESSAGSTVSEAGVEPVAEGPPPGAAHTPGGGCPKVLRASALQLEEWSRRVACPAAIYCGSLARQLREMATGFDNK